MYIFSKINLRRICAICLISLTLFITSAINIGYQNQAFAEVLKPETQEKPLNDAEYESAKAKRSQLQAERSKLAKKANERTRSQDVEDKLNLDEITPPKIKDVLDN
jgi:uncharacterized protein YlxW (UPF0749 family)